MSTITCFGDSITMGWYPVTTQFPSGWGVALNQTYPYRLLARLVPNETITTSDISPWSGNPSTPPEGTPATNKVLTAGDYTIYNAGIGGDTTAEMLARWSIDVLGHDSDIIVILAGVNDISQGVPVNTTKANLSSIYDNADAEGFKVIVGTILPWNNGTTTQRDYVDEINAWIVAEASTRGYTLVDFFNALELPDGSRTMPSSGTPDYTDDGVHPTASGYQVMADTFELESFVITEYDLDIIIDDISLYDLDIILDEITGLPIYVGGKQVLEIYVGGKRVTGMYVGGKSVF